MPTLLQALGRRRRGRVALSIVALAGSFAGESAHAQDPNVTFETTFGRIQIELFSEKAPISVENFLAYLESGFFEGTICHRVIANFMIQCGGFTADIHKKPTRPPIRNESANGLSNARGSVSMARRPIADSATSQFFINVANNAFLDHDAHEVGYTVFGRVVAGMEVVDEIAALETRERKGHKHVPVKPVIIEAVSVDPGS